MDAYNLALQEIESMAQAAHKKIEDAFERDIRAFSTLNPYMSYLGVDLFPGKMQIRDENNIIRIQMGILD